MDDDDLAGVLLSRFAVICEDLASVAAQTETASDAAALAAMQKHLADAAAMLDAIAILVPGEISE